MQTENHKEEHLILTLRKNFEHEFVQLHSSSINIATHIFFN